MKTSLKTCFKCGETKPLLEFYKHPKMADGHLGKCKTCARRDSTVRRWSKPEAIRQYDNQRATLPHRKAARLSRQKSTRRTKRGKLKQAAYNAVTRAIASGRLIRKPCQVCQNPETEAHHHDYNFPLDVVWLCTKHHRQAHAGRVIA